MDTSNTDGKRRQNYELCFVSAEAGLSEVSIHIPLIKFDCKCILNTDKIQEWAMSSVSFDTVSKMLHNPGSEIDFKIIL